MTSSLPASGALLGAGAHGPAPIGDGRERRAPAPRQRRAELGLVESYLRALRGASQTRRRPASRLSSI